MENVWELGGLSILTSVPITPRVVCFLCASSGHVEVWFPANVHLIRGLFGCNIKYHCIEGS